MEKDTVIIGGGLAGIMAAVTLTEQGSKVRILDKGRSVGGRMATRRIGEGKADHGAQFFTVRTDAFKHHVSRWEQNSWVRRWFGDDHPRYMAHDGMNRLVKELASGLEVSLETKVKAIEEGPSGFVIYGDTPGGPAEIQADRIIVTVPVPQSLQMTYPLVLNQEAEKQLKSLVYAPSYVLLVTLEGPSKVPDPGIVKSGLPASLDTVADNRQKGISDETIVSIYASGEWAEANVDLSKDEIITQLMDIGADYFDPAAVTGFQLKKWRYAEVKETHKGNGFIDAGLRHPLLFAGDAFITPEDPSSRSRVESAVLSGIAAGKHLTKG
ncbi:hypothetical protein CR205_14230 [Alteribacter lacisalsi]|uniref:Amine oxidase domain-containing protein n=1 Tax=Alteribacter lacisalsi TaxID=2045244 RepID=A0A2W0H4S5_9BACI|nr:FAD-dependent oxidoreductase [Alteribacter lacisalsi]PYZ96833.1 hypothetical protein CR205_14230 [Alteribacter lacisalsi]